MTTGGTGGRSLNVASMAAEDPDRYPQIPFDMVKEAVVSSVIVAVLVVVAAAIFGAPWVQPLTIQHVAKDQPLMFMDTAVNELANTSAIAQYGPPYNNGTGSLQSIGWFSPQKWAGVTQPINTAQTDVIQPLKMAEPLDPQIAPALALWSSATPAERSAWATQYENALGKATVQGGQMVIPSASDGPVPTMMNALHALAVGGLMSGALDRTAPVYRFNVAPSLLFLQGNADANRAKDYDLLGEEWGIMHDEVALPGPWWLAPYTALYQIPPYDTSSSGDLGIAYTMLILFLLLIAVPFVPGLRRLPEKLGVHKLIWRDWYRSGVVPEGEVMAK